MGKDLKVKICNQCKLDLPLSAFHKCKHNPDGHQYTCKKCQKLYENNRYKNNSEYRERKKAWCRKSQQKGYCPRKERKRKLKQNFNLTVEQYQEMLKKQNGVCAICKQPEKSKHQNGKVRQLAVDHNHKTGKVRGLLCGNCNQRLGTLMSIDFTTKALKYLKGGD